MKWKSQEEIKRRAEISDEEALNVSIEGWEQKCEALKAGEDIGNRHHNTDCGLCYRHATSVGSCPLSSGDVDFRGYCRCCNEWKAFDHFRTLENAQEMLNRLYLERGKRYSKEEPKKVCKKEPELRHGDYGLYPKGGFWIVLLRNTKLEVFGTKMGSGSTPTKDWPAHCLGNISDFFDDLKRNAEDLDRFRVNCSGCPDKDTFYAQEEGCRIGLRITGSDNSVDWCHCTFKDVAEIHQKLGQLLATARRKKKDC